jgi:hypothetical protein
MNSIPSELKQQILQYSRDFLPDLPFGDYPDKAMEHDDEYYNLLLQMSYHKEWRAVAQSELFDRIIILVNESKTELLLKLLKDDGVFANYAKSVKSIRIGKIGEPYDGTTLEATLGKLANYCPEIVEISCVNVNDVRLQYFGKHHFHKIQHPVMSY